MIKGGTNMEFSIITLIIGILGFVLGFMVRKYKMGNLVSWVNLKKYDHDNYQIKVFSEQYNGDYKTDYASELVDLKIE